MNSKNITLLIVIPVWNSNSVVMANLINSKKSRLDKFWSSHDFLYHYRVQPLTSEVLELKFPYDRCMVMSLEKSLVIAGKEAFCLLPYDH